MIDEELLQELLARASSLYNNGDYKGAIDTWNEVLQADPTNSKKFYKFNNFDFISEISLDLISLN